MTTDELESVVRRLGLARPWPRLKAHLRQTVQLLTMPAVQGDLDPSQSRVGGVPHLPFDVDWPCHGSKPLTFLAQIRMSQLPPISRPQMPTSGVLYFFCLDGWTGSHDPKERSALRVLYEPDETADMKLAVPPLVRQRSFLRHERHVRAYNPCSINFRAGVSLPDSGADEIAYKDLGLTDEEREHYDTLTIQHLYTSSEEYGDQRMFGYCDSVQGQDQRIQCQLISEGIDPCKASEVPHAHEGRHAQSAREWELLLQLGEDTNAGMFWGDFGYLYFWIRSKDLANCRFDDVCMLMEYY